MRAVLLTVASTLAVSYAQTAGSTDAPAVNNPPAAQYIAITPAGGSKEIISEIAVQGNPNGTGAWFTININGPPLTGGPFLYHIHDKPVPENGNCTATTAHMDPYGRGETPPCDPNSPASCQTGDLSGKHGTIQDLPGYSTQYIDAYISLVPGDPSFIGNRSWVLHYANKTRIACANFKAVDANGVTPPAGLFPGGSSSGGSSAGGSAGGPASNLTMGGGGSAGSGATSGGSGGGSLTISPGATPSGPSTTGKGAGAAGTTASTSDALPRAYSQSLISLPLGILAAVVLLN